MNDTTYPLKTHQLHDLLALANRLTEKRTAPPAPLPRHWDRDGPVKDQQHRPAPRRDHGAHGTAQSPSGTRRGVWTTFGGN